MRLHPSTWVLLAGCWVASCSLINAPDDVVPEATGGSSTTGGNGGTGNVGNVGNGGNAGDGGDGTSGSSGSAGSAGSAGTGVGGDGMGGGGGGGAEAGAGGEGGSGVDPATGGLIVIGAENKEVPPKRVLSVLTASNGDELVREVLPVAAIAYDDADKLWYVFKAAQFPAQGLSTADLEVRRFNDDTGLWSTLGTATALPPPQPDQFVVLNDRLVYLSYQVVGGAPVSAITVLNTANPAAVTELATRPAAAGSTYEGVIGDRGSDVDANAVGGRLRLMISSGCTGNDCALAAQLVSVANGLTDLTSVNLGRYAGQPRFVRARTEDKVYMALRSLSPANRMEVRGYTGLALTNPTTFTFSVVTGDNVGGFDLVECATAGLFSDVAGSQLIAFNLRSGAARVQPLGHPGAPVYTEPYGQQAIVLDSSAAPGLRSFEVSQSGQNNVAINLRTTWDPPEDLKPLTGATRRGATCQ